MQTTLFGMTEAQFGEIGSTVGITALILYMMFIVGNLAYRSKAGKLGTFVLFFVLSFGMIAFVAKMVLEYFMDL